MSASNEAIAKHPEAAPLSFFERYLTIWVALCIVAGIALGQLFPAPVQQVVFVWSRLTGGDPYFTLSQVALNDTIMIFAFAPIVALLLGISSITVPWD